MHCVDRIGFGFNRDPQMLGSSVALALPGAGTVKQYELVSKTVAGIELAATQHIANASVIQSGGHTVMKFSRALATTSIHVDKPSRVVWAYGGSNTLAYVITGSNCVGQARVLTLWCPCAAVPSPLCKLYTSKHTAKGVNTINVRDAGCFRMTSCSGHGACASGVGGSCTCDTGYSGADCSACDTGFSNTDGVCSAASADVTLTFTAGADVSDADFRTALLADLATALSIPVARLSIVSTDTVARTAKIRVSGTTEAGATPVAALVEQIQAQVADASSALRTGSSSQHVDPSASVGVRCGPRARFGVAVQLAHTLPLL